MINTKFKNWAIHQSIYHPKRTLTSALIITLVMGFGLQHFVIEDDMMKMIPKSVKTRVVWEEVKDEFGNKIKLILDKAYSSFDTKNIVEIKKIDNINFLLLYNSITS